MLVSFMTLCNVRDLQCPAQVQVIIVALSLIPTLQMPYAQGNPVVASLPFVSGAFI